MAARKKLKTYAKPQYVRAKRKGGEGSLLPRRALTLGLLLLVVAGIVFGIGQGYAWINRKLFSENPRFEIQHLVISSDGKLSEERIREYTGLHEGTNLFAVSFREIEKSLAQVPLVESVVLERKLPHTLTVTVKERVAVARISGRTERKFPYLVDRYGYVLPPRQNSETLPMIMGLENEPALNTRLEHPDVETALRIIAICDSSSYLRNYVRLLSLDVRYSDFIDMRLEGGMRVRMPRYSLKPKLQNLATVIKIAAGQGQRVKEVDLTLDSGKVPVTYY